MALGVRSAAIWGQLLVRGVGVVPLVLWGGSPARVGCPVGKKCCRPPPACVVVFAWVSKADASGPEAAEAKGDIVYFAFNHLAALRAPEPIIL